MKLTCVGLGPAHCMVLTLRRTHLLLDCALWPASGALVALNNRAGHLQAPDAADELVGQACLGPFLPLIASFTTISAVLLTTAEAILALPHLLARFPGTSLIQGPIYATVAALDAARHVMAEMAGTQSTRQEQHVVSTPVGSGARAAVAAACGARMPADSEPVAGTCWYGELNQEWQEQVLSRIKVVRYGQAVALDGLELTGRAFPTGSSMGAAAWVISDGCRNVGYLSDWQLPATPGSCLQLDPVTLSHLHVLICSASVTHIPKPTPPCQPLPLPTLTSPQAALQAHLAVLKQMHGAVLSVLSKGGSAMIPLPATGVAWSVIEGLASVLEAAGLLGQVPLVYCSPAARDSLALATTSIEFMSRAHQARAPDQALPFTTLQASGQLVVGDSLSDPLVQTALQAPCLVITCVSSLAGGDAWQLLNSWGSKPNNACMLLRAAGCDPGVMETAIRNALPGIQMQLLKYDIGGPPPLSHLVTLLSQLQPSVGQVAMSEEQAEHVEPWTTVARSPTQCHAYTWLDRLHLKLPKHVMHVEASPQLLQKLTWTSLGGSSTPHADYVAAKLTAVLKFSEGGWHLEPVPAQTPSFPSLVTNAMVTSTRQQWTQQAGSPPQLLAGTVSVEALVAALQARGLTQVEVQTEPAPTQSAAAASPASGPSTQINVPELGGHIQSVMSSTKKMLFQCPDNLILRLTKVVLLLVPADVLADCAIIK